MLPDIIIDHYNDINSLQKIDLQAINKHLETTDTLYQNVQIDNALENKILSLLGIKALGIRNIIPSINVAPNK